MLIQKEDYHGSDQKIVRGYLSLGMVHITSSVDFLVYVWARNVETFAGGVQIITPSSQFRGRGIITAVEIFW
jgi:hypothetical protein